MMKRIFYIFCFCFTLSALYSYQWPTNKDYLKSLFGKVSNGTIQDGIRFNNDDQAIYPLADGEIIYYQDHFHFGDLEFDGDEGNLLVLKHIGEFKSIYRNFTTSDSFDSFEQIKKTEMIGISSNKTDDFIFSIYDDKKEAYINPQQILPFLEDNRSPVINSAYLENDLEKVTLSTNIRLSPGQWMLTIDSWDVMLIKGEYSRLSPFSINVFVDGFERYNASFSSIKEIEGALFLSGESVIPLDKIKIGGSDLIYGGEIFLTNGRSLIEIVIKDIDGNEASRSFPVIVE